MENTTTNQNPELTIDFENGYPYIDSESYSETVGYLESRISSKGFIGCVKF